MDCPDFLVLFGVRRESLRGWYLNIYVAANYLYRSRYFEFCIRLKGLRSMYLASQCVGEKSYSDQMVN